MDGKNFIVGVLKIDPRSLKKLFKMKMGGISATYCNLGPTHNFHELSFWGWETLNPFILNITHWGHCFYALLYLKKKKK